MSIFEDAIEHYIPIQAKGERSYNLTGGVGNVDNADNLQFLNRLIDSGLNMQIWDLLAGRFFNVMWSNWLRSPDE